MAEVEAFKTKKILNLITGNVNKIKEFQSILGDNFTINSIKINLDELQGDPIEVAKAKALLAFNQVKQPAIIEDTSLCFNSMKGLPGPYIKCFSDKLGNDGIYQMIEGFEDKSGYAQCIIAYMDEEFSEPKVFIGKTDGTIVKPRGSKNFGWDPIFQPINTEKTFAEMEDEEKNEISHRRKAINEMLKYFQS